MLQIQKLESLSRSLGIKLSRLNLVASQSPSLYSQVIHQKKDGGERIIYPPNDQLKIIQRRILDKILLNLPISPHAFGWVKGRSRFDCVKGHVNKKLVYCADISDFFPSIHYTRVYRLFNKKLNCSPDVSGLLTRLTTYKGSLPQGSPSSPMITNIILKPFDDELYPYWKSFKAFYSRFGDDIIVSSNLKLPQFKIVTSKKVKNFGLKVNPKKFATMDSAKRQQTLGLIINEKVNIPKEEVLEIKAILHKAKLTNLEGQNKNNHPNFKDHLAGRIVQIKIFNPKIGETIWSDYQEIINT